MRWQKPNSSAPSSAAIDDVAARLEPPSVCRTTRLRRSFSTNVWCVSARPSSHGRPACLMLVSGDAPGAPVSPEIRIMSAWAFATPAATVPTPTSDTSFTLTRADGLAFFRSWINCVRSSIE